MKKVMISQPMANKTEIEILSKWMKAALYLDAKGYEVVNTLFPEKYYNTEEMKEQGVKNIPLCFLAKSFEAMSICDTVYFCKGWKQARGCKIEHEAAKAYELEIEYEH